ncbi:HIT family hydrolase [Actinoplanes sp. SE50]|uniref:HIT family protein n=1 Tax=unclassified Actinoplanes TaxID=2626549 RepID=UPI00023EC1EC|nr:MULTISPECIES: HIT family protein [unclassified Actinoplanes]AEV81860.1 putative HIT-like protein [Actinoplanes sp. SE50/110]ATO80261.1 HIT family hydrolase [Actinoplanes sp. SE50]SLL97666.1 HIT family protein [Actinoplanes sp. SE50/110]
MADCVFCGIVAGDVPAFKVADEAAGVAFLDTRPVFKGHVLVVPRPHIVQLTELPPALLEPYFGFVRSIAAAVPAALGSGGTFVAMNNLVSQSVPHLHTHVVPRTRGDGLRGFFWPRRRYDSDAEAAEIAGSIGKELHRAGVTDSGRRE